MKTTSLLFVILAVNVLYTYGTPIEATFGGARTGQEERSLSLSRRLLGEAKRSEAKKILFQNTHKMGSILSYDIRKNYFDDIGAFLWNTRSNWRRFAKQTVITTRDMFDATVSGYLYHKSGHECWLNQYGKPNRSPKGGNDYFRRENWTEQISKVPTQNLAFPEFNLCQVLTAVDEEIGIGIYLEFARNKYYKILPELKSKSTEDMLWMCFEDMKDDIGAARRIRDHFGLPPMPTNITSRRRDGNSHSTNPDPVMRKRLYSIARDLDCKYFDCEIKKWNDILGCKSSIQSDEESDNNSNLTQNQVEEDMIPSALYGNTSPYESYGWTEGFVQGFATAVAIGLLFRSRYMPRSQTRVRRHKKQLGQL